MCTDYTLSVIIAVGSCALCISVHMYGFVCMYTQYLRFVRSANLKKS